MVNELVDEVCKIRVCSENLRVNVGIFSDLFDGSVDCIVGRNAAVPHDPDKDYVEEGGGQTRFRSIRMR